MATKTTSKAPKAVMPEPIGVTAEGRPRFETPRIVERIGSHCDTARKVAADAINSSHTPDQWHDLCPVVVIDGRGTVHRCSDISHAGHATCTWCGADEEIDLAYLRCVDTLACATRRQEQVAQTDRAQAIKAWDEATAAEKAKRPDPVDDEGVPRPKRVKGEGRPTTGECHHCGEATKGGRFVAGHDSKLKGILVRVAQGGGPVAVAEMLARGWLKRPDELDPEVLAKGEEIAQDSPEHLIIETCTRVRMRRMAEGADSEQATKEYGAEVLVSLTSEETT
jgi:hypothetical protein